MKYLALFLLPALLFIGCSSKPEPVTISVPKEMIVEPIPESIVVLPKSPFSTKIIVMHNLSPLEICDLQFYISHDIELQKTTPEYTSSISDGTLVVNKQDKIKKILIKKDTPCIAIKAEDNLIVVKFNDTFELTFMHSKNKKDLFFLSANKWKKGVGSLMVGDELYEAVGSSGKAYLKINQIDVDNTDQNATVIEGSILAL